MTAVFDTYCTSEKPEFSLFGNFIGKTDDGEKDSILDLILVKSDRIELYNVTKKSEIQLVSSSRLLLSPVSCTTVKGPSRKGDYIALLFMNWEILFYRYSNEFQELELVNKNQIEIRNFVTGISLQKDSQEIIDIDENIKLEQLEFGERPNENGISLMITNPKFLLFINYKIKANSDFDQELSLENSWGISTTIDLFMDTIVDCCQILDENTNISLQPKIALISRIGPISTGSIQSHSNSVSLMYLSLNMEMMEFTVLDKLDLLPMDSYKVICIDTRETTNICLSGGVIVLCRNCIIIHSGLTRPFTIITTNDTFERVPEKKLEIEICTQKVHGFKPKIFEFETGAVSENSTTPGEHSSVGISSPSQSSSASSNSDLKPLLLNLQPVLISEPELSLELDISNSVPFLITNDYYGILFFNNIQPYLVGLLIHLSTDKPNGIKSFHFFKVNEYWDWTRSYISKNAENKIMSLETLNYSKKLRFETFIDELYLISCIPIFPVQNTGVISNSNDLKHRKSLLLVGGNDSNSGISLLNFVFNDKLLEKYSCISNINNSSDNCWDYKRLVDILKMKEDEKYDVGEGASLMTDSGDNGTNTGKNKRIKSENSMFELEGLEQAYIFSDLDPHQKEEKSGLSCCETILRDIEINDYLDLGPNSLRDFCLIPDNFQESNPISKDIIDDQHSILCTNGRYPVGQLSLYEKYVSKSIITKFTLDDIIFHWTLNDPLTNKTKYLIFTSDPLKSIGKTYMFSLDTCQSPDILKAEENSQIIVGDVNQLDPSEGNFDFEADSNTVGAGIIQMGDSHKDIFFIQTLPSSINIINFEITSRLLELDLVSSLFSDIPDAPMAIKSFVLGYFIVILFEDSTFKVLKISESLNSDSDDSMTDVKSDVRKGNFIAKFNQFQVELEESEELLNQLNELYDNNHFVVKQRVMEGESSQFLDGDNNQKTGSKHKFWFRHISPIITNSHNALKDPKDFLVVLVIYSELWLCGSLAIYNLAEKKLIFFSPYISAVPCLLGNIISKIGNKEETIYRLLENEFDLGRPITSVSTPIIEPKYYVAKEGEISISSAACLYLGSTVENQNQDLNVDTGNIPNSSSFLISCELISTRTHKSDDYEMILIVSISQRPNLVYRLKLNQESKDRIYSKKWKLQTQTNFSGIQMEISKFFALFPNTLNSSNIEETFKNESPLSIYNCGHTVSFSSDYSNTHVDTWIFSPPFPINNEFQDVQQAHLDIAQTDSDSSELCNSLTLMLDKGRLSIVNLEQNRSYNCIAKIDSPWSPLQILLTASLNNEISFQYLNLPYSSSPNNYGGCLATIPFPGADNWFLKRTFLPEVVVQRVAFCKEHALVAVIVGIPDNPKHHLNGYHIRQMAFYRYLRCLEAGGKEAQTILLNQDLIRNPEKCFEKSLGSVPDLGIPPANFDSETYFDTLPPGIEIGEVLPKIFHQSNTLNEKARNSENSSSLDPSRCNSPSPSSLHQNEAEHAASKHAPRGFEIEQFGILKDQRILRNELLIYSYEDLFPQSAQSTFADMYEGFESFPKPKGRYAFGAWEVGLSIKFGEDSKGQQILLVGTGTNPSLYYEAEGRLLMFRVKQLLPEGEGDLLGASNTSSGGGSGSDNNCGKNSTGSSKWTSLLKYWPSQFSKELYLDNVRELEPYFQSMYRGPVTNVDLVKLPATTSPIAPAIPALAAYPIIQNNSVVRTPNSTVTYVSHTFGYRLYVHELRENESNFVKGTFIDTSLGISSVSNYKALFFLGDIRRGVHFGMLRTDASRGSQTMVKLARSHPLWKFTCTSAQAITQNENMAILVSDSRNNIFTFEPNFHATQIIDKETLRPTSHANLSTTIVHMRTVETGNRRYVVASGRNGSFFLVKLTDKSQHEQLHRVERLLSCNIPSFLNISPTSATPINSNLGKIPQFIQSLYPTDKIIFLKRLNYLKYLSDPIIHSIFKNTHISFTSINKFLI
ncbi:CPSF A subunit region family protein [Cryptosporidium felis]|nr:CPSF A subunit region family protein [Cryptosporidium felis]